MGKINGKIIRGGQKLSLWIIRGHNPSIMSSEFPFSVSSSPTVNKELFCFLLCPKIPVQKCIRPSPPPIYGP